MNTPNFTQQRARMNVEAARDFVARTPARTDATQRAKAQALSALDDLLDEFAAEQAQLERDGRTDLELFDELKRSLDVDPRQLALEQMHDRAEGLLGELR